MIFLFGCLCLAVILTVGLVGVWYQNRIPDILVARGRCKVIVTLENGEGFRGVLWEQDRSGIVLRNADTLGTGERGTDESVDGEVFLLRERVCYLQIL